MSLGRVFDLLAQDVMPQIGATVFPYVMDISTQTTTQDAGGDIIESESAPRFTNVPVKLDKQGNVTGREPDAPIYANNRYKMTFPVVHEGERITLDQEVDIFTVQARGLEPERVFKIEVPRNTTGVIYEVIAVEQG